MKKAMVYILALTMVFSALLSGCGENKGGNATPTATPTATPSATVPPASMTPAPEDGIVNDEDGIITDDDNGADVEDILPGDGNDRTENGAGTGTMTGNGPGAANQ